MPYNNNDEANKAVQSRLEASRDKPKAMDDDRDMHGYDFYADRNFGPEDNVTRDDSYWDDHNPDMYA